MAEIDLRAAEVLLRDNLLPPAVFHCHLAVEKTLKALWIEAHNEGVPPRTHDLLRLMGEAGLELPEWRSWLQDLNRQAVASRYAGHGTFSEEETTDYIRRTKELCALLRPKLS